MLHGGRSPTPAAWWSKMVDAADHLVCSQYPAGKKNGMIFRILQDKLY